MKTKTLIAGVFLATVCVVRADITSVTLAGTGAADVNLTAEGTTDWIMLGQGGGAAGIENRDEKSGVNHIGAVTVTGTKDSWAAHPSRFTWTDGAPTATATDVLGDWEAKPLGGLDATDQALTFSVNDLAVGDYTMMLYTSSYKASQLLTATIGASSMTATHGFSNDATYYSIAFSIDTLGDVLDISFNRNDAGGDQYSNVGISAVTIAAVPEPATLGLIAACGGGILFIRRRIML
ncbi:PEP-CTERM sorting domain-containing protein [Pontiellaceae bacterium B12219]|nr:PEP-CTERM sorting domain-containing protein [Pontiellaceae bacterium B12219]